MQIRFSPESVEDLQRLCDFIAKHDLDSARTVALNLKSAIRRFADMPRIGRPLEDMKDIREFVFGRYVIRYFVKGEAVCILRIWHSKEQRSELGGRHT